MVDEITNDVDGGHQFVMCRARAEVGQENGLDHQDAGRGVQGLIADNILGDVRISRVHPCG